MDPCYIYEQQFGIHESFRLTATQVPGVCFKVSFKLQLFARVNPTATLTAINKTFENSHWACGCALSKGEINHCVPGGRQLAFEPTVPFGLVRRLTAPFFTTPIPPFPNEFPAFFRGASPSNSKQMTAGPTPPRPACLSIQSCVFYIDGDGIWPCLWLV